MRRLLLTVSILAACAPALAHAEITAASVVRTTPDKVLVTWTSKGAVDVFVSDSPDADLKSARRVADDDRDGQIELPADLISRPYVLLKDEADGRTARVAERVLPLVQGSNFRDLGGYAAADGRHVKWGRIYRSGATPNLTADDVARIKALGLSEMVDLRSSDERVMAPSRIQGVPYVAVGYSMGAISGPGASTSTPMAGMEAIYRNFPTLLAPQLKLLFAGLLKNDGPVVFNCSAGQDRTGFATALILSALGTPRDQIIADYHLSTAYRRPQFEMPKVTPEMVAANPGAAIYAAYQKDPKYLTPQPLKDAQGRAYLEFALDEVVTRWGSVEAYLGKEVGVSAADIARLRALYTE